MFAIQFFPAAKLFNGLPCRSFSVHHFAKETLLQTNFVKKFLKFKTKLATKNLKLEIFHRKFPYEVVYDFLAG